MIQIDRKFEIKAKSKNSGTEYDESESILFLARDPAVPAIIRAYHIESQRLGCDQMQLDSIEALYSRIVTFQATQGTKKAAVETQEEAERLMGPDPQWE